MINFDVNENLKKNSRYLSLENAKKSFSLFDTFERMEE